MMEFKNKPTNNAKTLETEITCQNLLNSFLSLINQNKKEVA